MQRAIRLLIEIIDLSESFYAVESISLGSLYRGQKMNMWVDNNIQVIYSSPKQFNIKVFGNSSILEVKKKVAAELGKISWRHVTLNRKSKYPDIEEKHNSRTLRDMRISLGERLVSSSRPQIEKAEEPLLTKDGNISPKLDAAIREVYRRFCAGKPIMSPNEACHFVCAVLEMKQCQPDD